MGESYHKERIIGQTNFYRVMTLGFTVASPSAASPSAASGLFRLGEASGKLCLLVVSALFSLYLIPKPSKFSRVCSAPATGGGARGRRRQLPLLFIFVICSGLPFFLVIVVLLGSVVGAPVRFF